MNDCAIHKTKHIRSFSFAQRALLPRIFDRKRPIELVVVPYANRTTPVIFATEMRPSGELVRVICASCVTDINPRKYTDAGAVITLSEASLGAVDNFHARISAMHKLWERNASATFSAGTSCISALAAVRYVNCENTIPHILFFDTFAIFTYRLVLSDKPYDHIIFPPTQGGSVC